MVEKVQKEVTAFQDPVRLYNMLILSSTYFTSILIEGLIYTNIFDSHIGII